MRLREERKKQKIPVAILAEILGVKRVAYFRKETGKSPLNREEMVKLAHFLKKPVTYLFFDENVS